VAENFLALTLYRHPQAHSFLDLEIPREDPIEFDKTGFGAYRRKKTEPSKIDSDDRSGAFFNAARNAQKGPVSTDHDYRFDCFGDVDFLRSAAKPRVIDIFLKKNINISLLEPFFEFQGKLGGFRTHVFIDYCDMAHLGPPKH
jgi:hypothetical protein